MINANLSAEREHFTLDLSNNEVFVCECVREPVETEPAVLQSETNWMFLRHVGLNTLV